MTDTDTQALIDHLKEIYAGVCEWIGVVDGDIYMVHLLAYHCSVLINPYPMGGAEQRYCYHNAEIALKAITELPENDFKLRYWKKDHTKNISIDCGNLLFNSGDYCIPENAIGEVDWDISTYEDKYPYKSGFF